MSNRTARLAGVRAVTRPAAAWLLAQWFLTCVCYAIGFACLRLVPQLTNQMEQLDELGSPSSLRSKLHVTLIVACACVLLYTLFRWLCIRYEFSSGTLRLSAGVLRRVHVAVPTDRMQDVVSRQSVFERIFGLASVTVSTASGRTVTLRSLDSWQRIERALRRMMGTGTRTVVLMSAKAQEPTTHKRPPVIGLAGGIGSGKSTVARAFADLGCVISDSDAQTREMLAQQSTIDTLVSWWGKDILASDGTINRAAVAAIVFNDETQRRRLEHFIHPKLHKARAALLAESQARAVVVDAPLLFEAGVDKECDAVVFVDCPQETRLERVKRSRHWTEDDLARRESAQMPLQQKRERCRFVIENSDHVTQTDLRHAAERVLKALAATKS
ncbi:MAG: dephospho-CoA kinase [Phycisphaeraceae bacterium]|nr:dephospho-CoA kinase [Phycisphaerales bacterium]MCB9860506.1 dephospho-CoA kinase [Phycisphaeraceae bacterium]